MRIWGFKIRHCSLQCSLQLSKPQIRVRDIQKQDRRTGRLTEGVFKEILTKFAFLRRGRPGEEYPLLTKTPSSCLCVTASRQVGKRGQGRFFIKYLNINGTRIKYDETTDG